jgi:hypothetical protein
MLVETALAEAALDIAGRAHRQVDAPVFGMSRSIKARMLFKQMIKILFTVNSQIWHALYLPLTLQAIKASSTYPASGCPVSPKHKQICFIPNNHTGIAIASLGSAIRSAIIFKD